MPNFSSIPSLTDLMKKSRRVTPLDWGSFEQQYVGCQICWQLVFATAVPIGRTGTYQVLATQRTFWQRYSDDAFFEIDPALFPELQRVLPGRRLRICGAIRELKAGSVTLDVQSVEALAETFFDKYRY